MFSVPENTCQGLPPGPLRRRTGRRNHGAVGAPIRSDLLPVFTIKGFDFFPPCPPGRDGNRQVNVIPFHAGSFLRNPSLPAGIIETGATPSWGGLDRTP